MSQAPWEALAAACPRADLSIPALHVRYVALGGLASLTQLTAYLAFGQTLSEMEHDVAVQAINERFLERDDAERLPYRGCEKPR